MFCCHRRVKEFSTMVSNTVGLSVLKEEEASPSACAPDTPQHGASPKMREFLHTHFHWKTSDAGAPAAVFSADDLLSKCPAAQRRLWPIAGMSVAGAQRSSGGAVPVHDLVDGVRLVILADAVCLPAAADGPAKAQGRQDALDYGDYDTVLLVVDNPYDAPVAWSYRYKVFPKLSGGKLKW
jgi:hypothetical protein